MKTIKTNRGIEWLAFSDTVLAHIEGYTVPQYGDSPDDNVESWLASDCVRQIGKYLTRFGKNSRDGQECLDLLKVAHYACLAYAKTEKEV